MPNRVPESGSLVSRSAAVPKRDDRVLVTLSERAQGYALSARARNTIRAYDADWRHFCGWCDERGLTALPADAATLSMYVSDLAGRYKQSTINRRLATISVAHRRTGHPSPTSDAGVQEVLSGVKRTHGVKPDEARPLTIGDLRVILAHIPADMRGLRDRALLLVGFAGALRRSELVAIDIEDLEPRPEGIVLHVRRSKVDPDGAGHEVALPHGTDKHTCPVRAIEAWTKAAGIHSGPLFRGVNRHGGVSPERLTSQSVSLVLRRCAGHANVEASRLSGHSLRAGFATSAAANGATEYSIMRQTGHRSTTMLRKYVRHGSVFIDNAATRIGL